MITPSDPITVTRGQRRMESPIFWVIVFAGSLLIHLLLALGMRSLLVQTIQASVELEPIAVEFAEATDAVSAPPARQPNRSPSQTVPSTPTTASPASTGQPATSPVEPPSPRLPTPSASWEDTPATPEPARPVQQSSQPTSAPSSSPQPVAPPNPTPTPTPPNRAAALDAAASSLKTRLSNPAVKGPIASGIRLPDVPNVPSPVDNPGRTAQSSNLPVNPLAIAKAPTPAKFLAQIQILPVVNQSAIDRSTGSTPAAIQGEPVKELLSDTSSCLLTPEALSAFGEAVVLTVSLNEQGRLQGEPTIRDRSSSGNSRYDELAACVLKQWTFSPAYDQIDENTRSAKPATIHVQVKITE